MWILVLGVLCGGGMLVWLWSGWIGRWRRVDVGGVGKNANFNRDYPEKRLHYIESNHVPV